MREATLSQQAKAATQPRLEETTFIEGTYPAIMSTCRGEYMYLPRVADLILTGLQAEGEVIPEAVAIGAATIEAATTEPVVE
jgi:hypothetical protein